MKKLLFFGDSVTDMGRDRNQVGALSYGMGYVFLLSTFLQEKYPGKYQIINKGCGGNTILDLMERYKEDVIKEKPDVVTILIGVNDVWHRIYNSNSRGSTIDFFLKYYEQLINELMKALPNCKIILMEPFFTKGEVTTYQDKFLEFAEIYTYAKKSKLLAKKYHIPFINLQDKISKAQLIYSTYCLTDGIHPNVVGASIIAKQWYKKFKKLEGIN